MSYPSWSVRYQKPTNRASVGTGHGNRFLLQNPLSQRWDGCHIDRILAQNGLAVSTLWMVFRSFLHRMAQVIFFINRGFLLTKAECLLSARPSGSTGTGSTETQSRMIQGGHTHQHASLEGKASKSFLGKGGQFNAC